MESQDEDILLSIAYLAPIQYFTKLISGKPIYIEHCESYLKQTYRNRTIILAANGPLQLSLPVVDGPRAKGLIREIKLTYDHQWQQIHWRGISAAYNNSPFFEYYADDFAPFFHQKKWKFLVDFNAEIQNVLLETLEIKPDINYTQDYISAENVPARTLDYRYSITPKLHRQAVDPSYISMPYTQVFNERWGFVPNLSILDLLFNEGPATVSHLRSCIK